MPTEREKILEWAELAGTESAKHHHKAADDLGKECTTTLTILMAGAGGALAYAAKTFEGAEGTMVIASSAVCAWLFALAAVLVVTCLRVRDIEAVYNEPLNLFQPAENFMSLREQELGNLQSRIKSVIARNSETAVWLNRVRFAAIATPAVGVVTWCISTWAPAFSS